MNEGISVDEAILEGKRKRKRARDVRILMTIGVVVLILAVAVLYVIEKRYADYRKANGITLESCDLACTELWNNTIEVRLSKNGCFCITETKETGICWSNDDILACKLHSSFKLKRGIIITRRENVPSDEND